MGKEADKNQLADFDWDNPTEVDFFGVKAIPDNAQEPDVNSFMDDDDNLDDNKDPEQTPDNDGDEDSDEDEPSDLDKEKGSKSGRSKKEVKDPTFFEKTDDDEPTGDENPEIYVNLYKDLQQKGLFTEELSEDEELDEEGFFDRWNNEIDNRVEEGFAEFMEQLDNDGKKFLKFSKNGGTLRQFLAIAADNIDMPEVDMDTVDGQKAMMRYALRKEGYDAEDINDQIEFLEEKGRLASTAKKKQTKILEEEEEAKAEMVERQANAIKAAKENRTKFIGSLKSTLDKTQDINGLPFSKKDKDLIDYITEATEKLENGKYASGFQVELANVTKDPEKMLLLAKLLKTGFDFSSIEKKAETNVTKKQRTNLSRMKNNNKKPISSGTSDGKKLADMF